MYTGKARGRGFVIKKLEVTVAATTVAVDHMGISVNSFYREGPYADDVLYVKQTSGNIYLIRMFGVVIVYDTDGTSLHIHVSPYYSDKVLLTFCFVQFDSCFKSL